MNPERGVGSLKNELSMTGGVSTNFDYNMPLIIEDTQVERIEGFVRPTGGLTQMGPFELVLPAQSDSYLITQNLSLYLKMKITRENGENLQATDVVAPINCLGTTMWEHTEISINDYILSTSSTTNTHYKSYIETILTYDQPTAESYLVGQFFAMDSPGAYENFTGTPGTNKGFIERRDYCQRSRAFDLITPITADFLRTQNYLAPNNKLTIKLYRARNEFILNTTDITRYKLEILDMKLYYHRVRLIDKISPPGIERYLSVRTELKRFPVPAGMRTYNFKIHYGGKMPKSVVIAQVLTAACEGSYDRNPLHFRHFNINQLALKVNGRTVPPDTLQPDFDADTPLVMREFVELFKNSGTFRGSRGNCVSLQQFRNGCTIFPFDLTPDMCNGAHLHISKEGDIGVEIGWSQELVLPITILAHLSYDEVYIHKRGDNEYSVEVI